MKDLPPPPGRTRPSRRVLFRFAAVVFVLVVTILSLVIAELALRASAASALYQEARRRPPHPFLQVLPGGQVDHVNPQGFRGEPVEVNKPVNTFRIFAVGGSTTLGVANPYAESYPYLLQALLRERHPGIAIEVENAGSSWYTSAHDVVAYELEVRRYQPDLVIYFEAINDLTRSFSPPWWARGDFKPDYSHYLGPYIRFTGPEVEYLDPRGSSLLWNRLRQFVLRQPSPFLHRDADNVARLAATMTAVDQPAFRSLPSFREYSATLLRAIQSDGHAVIVASQPFLYHDPMSDDERRATYFAPIMCGDGRTYPSLAAMINGMRLYNATLRSVADDRAVAFVDFESQVPKTLEYFSDDVHLRRAGNAVLATLVADRIDADKLVERAVKRP